VHYGFHPEDPTTWPCFRPLIIAHDVGRSNDRSTAVIGGLSPSQPSLIGVAYGDELPQGLYGHALANQLVSIDRRFQSNAVIVADISRDDSYAEILNQNFGRRVIGLPGRAMGRKPNGGPSKTGRCWSARSAAPI
jgi:hypothetical protein